MDSPNEIVKDTELMPEEEVIHRLETHPLSRAPQKLLAIDLQIHLDPTQRETLLDRAAQTWQTSPNESLAALARWLNNKREFQRELDTIPLARALQARDLFLQRLDALGALGQWSEIKRLLTEESFPLDPVIEHMYLARCSQQLGEAMAGANNWQRAFESADGDAQKLLLLGEYAEKNGATQIAGTAYNAIVRQTPAVRAAQQGRLRLAQQNRDTCQIHQILAQMLKIWPNDTAIQNDEAYSRLLLSPNGNSEVRDQLSEVSDSPSASGLRPLSTDLSKIESLAEELVRREPSSLPHRTLLALARLKLDQPDKAFEVYSSLNVPPNTASPSAIAVHAAVLAGNDRMEDARIEAGAVNWEQLLPEEQALIEKLRTSDPP